MESIWKSGRVHLGLSGASQETTLKGNRFSVILSSPSVCPVCHSARIHVKDHASSSLWDIVDSDSLNSSLVPTEVPRDTLLYILFQKRRYTCDTCKKQFSQQAPFFWENANCTRRFADYIAKRAMYYSFSDIEQLFRSRIDRRTLRRIFLRWVTEKEKERGNITLKGGTVAYFPVTISQQKYLVVWDPAASKPVDFLSYDFDVLTSFHQVLCSNNTLFLVLLGFDQQLLDWARKNCDGKNYYCGVLDAYVKCLDAVEDIARRCLGSGIREPLLHKLREAKDDLSARERWDLREILTQHPELHIIYQAKEDFHRIVERYEADQTDFMTDIVSWLHDEPEDVPELKQLKDQIGEALDYLAEHEEHTTWVADHIQYTKDHPDWWKKLFPYESILQLQQLLCAVSRTHGVNYEVLRGRLLYNSFPGVQPIPINESILSKEIAF